MTSNITRGTAVILSTEEPPIASRVWRFDSFVLDTARYELRRGSDVIRVEPQVFDVLTHLISNHHRCVSKAELFDSVWGRTVRR